MATHIRNFGWNRVKLSTLTYDQLEQLKKKVEEEHACNNGIFLYDKAGFKKTGCFELGCISQNESRQKVRPGKLICLS